MPVIPFCQHIHSNNFYVPGQMRVLGEIRFLNIKECRPMGAVLHFRCWFPLAPILRIWYDVLREPGLARNWGYYMKRQSSLAGQMMILSSALLWSTAGILIKLIPWGSLSIASVRGLICMLVLLALRFLRGKKGGFLPVRFTKHNVAAGAAMFVTGALFMAANKLTTAANAIVLQYIAPILILVYTAVVQKRRPTVLEISLTAVVFIGCVLAFCDKLGGSGTLGDILALISGFTFAALIVINRMDKTQPEDGQIIGCGLSFICCLPFIPADSKLVITWESVGAMLALGLIQYSLANILFAKGIKKSDPVTASIILTMEPIMNPVWVFLIQGEAPGALALVGFVLVVAAVTLQSLLPILRRRPQPGDVQSTLDA
jgi:drug/metabolite transporter (DMT)-like permease